MIKYSTQMQIMDTINYQSSSSQTIYINKVLVCFLFYSLRYLLYGNIIYMSGIMQYRYYVQITHAWTHTTHI